MEPYMIKHSLFITVALSLFIGCGTSIAQTPAPDNSKANANSANSTNTTSTADGQSNKANDLAITQQIRKSIIADKSLSTYAHNVKIVTVNGTVTLNGVVRDDREKSAVGSKAEAVAASVVNDLTVAPPK
jgi:osmotically-inducible protein OsmY